MLVRQDQALISQSYQACLAPSNRAKHWSGSVNQIWFCWFFRTGSLCVADLMFPGPVIFILLFFSSVSFIFSSQYFSFGVLELLTIPISTTFPLPAVLPLPSSWLFFELSHGSFLEVSNFLRNLNQCYAAMLYKNQAAEPWRWGWRVRNIPSLLHHFCRYHLHCGSLFALDSDL